MRPGAAAAVAAVSGDECRARPPHTADRNDDDTGAGTGTGTVAGKLQAESGDGQRAVLLSGRPKRRPHPQC